MYHAIGPSACALHATVNTYVAVTITVLDTTRRKSAGHGRGGYRAHPRTSNGLKDATTNPEVIEALWKKWPTARAGVALGSRSNLSALVTEGDEGEESLQRLRGHQSLKKTVTIRDDGRRIRLFRNPAGYTVRHVQLAPGLKALGENVCLVMPSGKITAKRRFARDLGIGQIEIAMAPQWLLDQITRTATKASSRRRRSSAGQKTTIKPQQTSESSVKPPPELGQSLARFGRPASRSRISRGVCDRNSGVEKAHDQAKSGVRRHH